MPRQFNQERLSNDDPEIREDSLPSQTSQLTHSLKAEAKRLGFELVGVCPAVTPPGFQHFAQWLDAGYAGGMNYLADRRSAYEHPQHVMQEVKSLLMLGMNYWTPTRAESNPGHGRIARYAWGETDYHDLIHDRLQQLEKFALHSMADAGMESGVVRGVVDTAPLLEREFAQLAGMGWSAKNTMLINRELGSWFFIAALLLNVELDYEAPFISDHCGTCTACLDACPTAAFPSAGVLDATRCISYLTIEHRGPIPLELRSAIGDWILGCDICQEVCPWNRKSPATSEAKFTTVDKNNPIELRSLFLLDDEQFRKRFRHTPLWRPKRRGILRNAAIALGNFPATENIPALVVGLNDVEPLVRGASAWALGQHRDEISRRALEQRLRIETEIDVRVEIETALAVS